MNWFNRIFAKTTPENASFSAQNSASAVHDVEKQIVTAKTIAERARIWSSLIPTDPIASTSVQSDSMPDLSAQTAVQEAEKGVETASVYDADFPNTSAGSIAESLVNAFKNSATEESATELSETSAIYSSSDDENTTELPDFNRLLGFDRKNGEELSSEISLSSLLAQTYNDHESSDVESATDLGSDLESDSDENSKFSSPEDEDSSDDAVVTNVEELTTNPAIAETVGTSLSSTDALANKFPSSSMLRPSSHPNKLQMHFNSPHQASEPITKSSNNLDYGPQSRPASTGSAQNSAQPSFMLSPSPKGKHYHFSYVNGQLMKQLALEGRHKRVHPTHDAPNKRNCHSPRGDLH